MAAQNYAERAVYWLLISFWKVVSFRELPILNKQVRASLLRNQMKKKAVINDTPVCQVRMQAISDAMSILSGKWKFHILGTLIEGQKLGFMDLLREVQGIGTKMLSKELRDLEMNRLVSRTVMATKPITVQYAITEYGKTLAPLIDELANWGIAYKKSMYENG